MLKIIICFKWVKAEDDLRIDPATLNVDLSKAKGKISEYDRNAIEAARLVTVENFPAYVSSKFAAVSLTEVLEMQLQDAGSKVRAHVACPSAVKLI